MVNLCQIFLWFFSPHAIMWMRSTEDIGHNHQHRLTPARDHNLGTYKIPVWECFPCLVLHAILWFSRPTTLWKLELAWSQSQLPSVLAPGKTIFCSSLWCLNVNYSCACTILHMNYPLMDQQENGVFSLATIKHLHNIVVDDKKYGLHHCLTFFFPLTRLASLSHFHANWRRVSGAQISLRFTNKL
jgi:hypothetical protein